MDKKAIEDKIAQLRKDRIEFAQKANEQITQKQQELAAMVKSAQRKIDQMEGAELALQELLSNTSPTKPIKDGSTKIP